MKVGALSLRKMGLDFGDKTIGVAISDSMELTAQGVDVIRRTDLRKDFEILSKYITDYQIDEIVVGFPKNMNGSLGPRAEKTQQFVNFLKNNVDLPVILWDERLSTVEAEKRLIEADLSRAKRKKVIDKVAASIILQGYLDFKNLSKAKGGINDE